ncbi:MULTISPECIES: hypothetical protein [unclassified Novosphingobium]|uniref:hypothetical protein n=1 Tax=unclassified Novosphingobium TaxID=2644732 RepID=UPI00146B0C77|nr:MULTISPECIES: hypothetical protein [unclassified Novosphingobium]NMN06385.1 hypothetical protein [Novosphingobium sp. SG919]NMN88683.1 hypothetical protein [Novosphingobium sp. SG916]
MILTFIGAIQVLFGLGLFLAGSIEAMFAFLLVSALFGGSAAIVLPMLGGSSIPPVQFALAFMALRLLVPGAGHGAAVGQAARANIWLATFILYGAALAFIGPRLFAGQIDVTPMRGKVEARYISMRSYIYSTRPLGFSTQNITTTVYLVGTLLTAMAAHVVCSGERGRRVFVRTMAIAGLVHAIIGFVSVVAKGTPVDTVLALFRNGSYAQLDHSYRGFVRMAGLWPEASGFAWFGINWFVFLFECWMRRVDTRYTGPAAFLLAAALLCSTATTAYVGLGLYAAMVLARSLLLPGAMPADRALIIAGAGLAMVVLITGMMIAHPALVNEATDLLRHMTVDKGQSLSGEQRGFWAWQGWHAFVETHGIGIGPGSFRSSSLATAILGCTGLIGATAMIVHLVSAFKPTRLSTYVPSPDQALSTGAACAWAAVIDALVASLSSPTCDPGTDFAILTGAALALRPIVPRLTPWRGPVRQLPPLQLSPAMALASAMPGPAFSTQPAE